MAIDGPSDPGKSLASNKGALGGAGPYGGWNIGKWPAQRSDIASVAPSPIPTRFYFTVHGYSDAEREKMVAQGGVTLIGVDHSNDNWRQQFAHIHDLNRRAGRTVALPHLYHFGPGDEHYDASEAKQLREAAASVGIDVGRSGGMAAWKDWGWKKHFIREARESKAWSAELDNLDQITKNDPVRTVALLAEMQALLKAEGLSTRIMLKNTTPGELAAIKNAIERGTIVNAGLAPFSLQEAGVSNDKAGQMRISAAMGHKTIFTVESKNGTGPTYQLFRDKMTPSVLDPELLATYSDSRGTKAAASASPAAPRAGVSPGAG